eukprot:ANDGO_00035.mRNA.1 Trafficking protein particle complex subunit 3
MSSQTGLTPQQKALQRTGETAYAKMEKVNAELFLFTYGALVSQLLQDLNDVTEVNTQIEKMGFNIGTRLIEEFLAKSGVSGCKSFEETGETIARVACKMFLGVTGYTRNWSADKQTFSLVIDENPLCEFVEIPEHAHGLLYSNIICGVIRGALEALQLIVQVRVLKDVLRDDETNEFEVKLIQVNEEQFFGDDD